MEPVFIIKTISTIVSAIAAWWGFRKLKIMIAAYREAVGPKSAKPHIRLLFSWKGNLENTKLPSLILHIGNQEKRTIFLEKAEWFSSSLRLKWQTEAENLAGAQIIEGQGLKINLNPETALRMLESTHYLATPNRIARMIRGLELTLHLQSGEIISVRTPGAMRVFLAYKHSLSVPLRELVRLHAFLYP